MVAEAGAGQCRQILLAHPRPVGGQTERAETAPPGQVHRASQIDASRIGGLRGQDRKGALRRLGVHALLYKSAANPPCRHAAPMQRHRTRFGVLVVVKQPRPQQAADHAIDDTGAILNSTILNGTIRAGAMDPRGPVHLSHQHPLQVFGGGCEPLQVEKGRILDGPLRDLARLFRKGHGAEPPTPRRWLSLAAAPPGMRTQEQGKAESLMQNPHAANWLGLWTLYLREVRRFAKVYTQTLLAPIVTTLLFLAIFSLALGRSVDMVGGVSYLQFLAPGLIMMAIMQNAFANTSSSLVISKVQGNIVDSLMPPLTAHELTFGFAMGGATRGIAVGLTVGLAMAPFVALHLHHPFFVIYHAFMASLFLSLLGVAGGIWSEKFDHIAAVTNFVVTPLSFLSGTFYTVERLPQIGQVVAYVNPFFYMIDGFRYGFIGHADVIPWVGVIVMAMVNLLLWLLCYWMFARGYKLKA
jgi:ABC-2 type transport system permease protein